MALSSLFLTAKLDFVIISRHLVVKKGSAEGVYIHRVNCSYPIIFFSLWKWSGQFLFMRDTPVTVFRLCLTRATCTLGEPIPTGSWGQETKVTAVPPPVWLRSWAELLTLQPYTIVTFQPSYLRWLLLFKFILFQIRSWDVSTALLVY